MLIFLKIVTENPDETMAKLSKVILICISIIVSSCISPGIKGPPNPYQGTYVGTITTEGGTLFPPGGAYRLKIIINASGKVKIVDHENVYAYGTLEGNKFHIVRRRFHEVFAGTISGNTISGTATENIFFGDATFTVNRE